MGEEGGLITLYEFDEGDILANFLFVGKFYELAK